MHRSRGRTTGQFVGATLAALAGLVLLAGCGSDGESSDGESTSTASPCEDAPAETAEESITAVVRLDDSGVEGVCVTALDTGSGELVGALTGADGRAELPLSGPGTFDVTFDAGTLPDGAVPREGRPRVLQVEVSPGQNRYTLFPLAAAADG